MILQRAQDRSQAGESLSDKALCCICVFFWGARVLRAYDQVLISAAALLETGQHALPSCGHVCTIWDVMLCLHSCTGIRPSQALPPVPVPAFPMQAWLEYAGWHQQQDPPDANSARQVLVKGREVRPTATASCNGCLACFPL